MNFAYLNLSEHPRGNIILQNLIKNNLAPSIIIEEKSSLALKNKKGLSDILRAESLDCPSTKDVVKKNIPIFYVKNHNDLVCEKLLKDLNPDLIVLGDTRIIKKNILEIPKIGIINSHPGYLPDVRGNNPYIWAIIHNLPQGCSVHFIDENVDTGDLLLRKRIKLEQCNSYADFLRKINALCAELIVKAVKQISTRTYNSTPQSKIKFVSNGNYSGIEFYAAPAEVKEQAIKIFKASNSTLSL